MFALRKIITSWNSFLSQLYSFELKLKTLCWYVSPQTKREKVCKNRDLDVQETSYADIMQRLVRRYLFKRERAKDAEGEKPKESMYLRGDDLTATDMYGGGGGMDFAESADYDYAEEDLPQGIPQSRSTPANNLDDSLMMGGAASASSRRGRRSGTKRYSIVAGGGIPMGFMSPFNIQLPQLDSIQRSQKVLDMRLQNLQISKFVIMLKYFFKKG
ncbi:hypothetical protein ACTXT7_005019 [Hymenolepis weldensis]